MPIVGRRGGEKDGGSSQSTSLYSAAGVRRMRPGRVWRSRGIHSPRLSVPHSRCSVPSPRRGLTYFAPIAPHHEFDELFQ